MKINYCRSAYVREVSDEMMDALRKNITSYADGDTNVCITFEDFISARDEMNDETTTDRYDLKFRDYINEVQDHLDNDPIGDLVFCRR